MFPGCYCRCVCVCEIDRDWKCVCVCVTCLTGCPFLCMSVLCMASFHTTAGQRPTTRGNGRYRVTKKVSPKSSLPQSIPCGLPEPLSIKLSFWLWQIVVYFIVQDFQKDFPECLLLECKKCELAELCKIKAKDYFSKDEIRLLLSRLLYSSGLAHTSLFLTF